MSYRPEFIDSPNDLEFEEGVIQETLEGQPWQKAKLGNGQERQVRSFATPLLDGSIVRLEERLGTDRHTFIVTKKGLGGEKQAWGWHAGTPLRWLTKKLPTAHPGGPGYAPLAKSESANEFIDEDRLDLTVAILDANAQILSEEQEVAREEMITSAAYDPELEERILATIYMDNGEAHLETVMAMAGRLMLKHGLDEEAALEAIDRCLDRTDADPHPLVTVVPFERRDY